MDRAGKEPRALGPAESLETGRSMSGDRWRPVGFRSTSGRCPAPVPSGPLQALRSVWTVLTPNIRLGNN